MHAAHTPSLSSLQPDRTRSVQQMRSSDLESQWASVGVDRVHASCSARWFCEPCFLIKFSSHSAAPLSAADRTDCPRALAPVQGRSLTILASRSGRRTNCRERRSTLQLDQRADGRDVSLGAQRPGAVIGASDCGRAQQADRTAQRRTQGHGRRCATHRPLAAQASFDRCGE